METQVETIVRVMRGNGKTDAQNAEMARRIVAELEHQRDVPVERPFRVAA